MAQAKQDLQAIINAAAEKEGLDPELLQKIGGAESGFRAGVKNPKSTAKGLFQFVDKTWAEMGGKPGEQYIPEKNAELGARYVKRNKDMLTQSLGREPSYGEVYAAHFFGPTGAKALLTKADPNAPIEQSLAIFESPKRVQKVLKQNPNLKGKTTAQVLADLDAKMGSKRPVVEEAPVAAPTAPAKPKMEMFRRPVPRFIRSEAPNLGTGYNAALALMGMTDTEADQDPLTKAQETVAENEAENEVADFGQAKKMLAEVQAPNAFANRQMPQQPRLMATGGEIKKFASGGLTSGVPIIQTPTLRADDKAFFEQTQADAEKYNREAEAYNAAIQRGVTQEDYFNLYGDVRDAGANAFQHYIDFGYNEGRQMPGFDPVYYLEVNPDVRDAGVNPFRHFLEFGATEGRSPIRPPTKTEALSLTPEQLDARAAEAKSKAQQDAENRGVAIDVANAPQNYNLSGFGFAGISGLGMFAKGGEAKKSDKDGDAERFFEDFMSAAKESAPLDLSFQSAPSQVIEGLGMVNAPPAVSGRVGTKFDALGGNVRIGAQGIAMQTPDKKIQAMPGMYDIGYNTQVGPGNLDLSFQRQIQSMPGRSKDYAVNARYSYKFAEGGEVKPEPEKGSAKAMLKEVARSTQYLPADIAGAPVDLINLGLQGVDALTGSKLAQKMPVGGSDYLIDKANKYGLMDKPTGSLTETLTRLGTGVLSPTAGPRAVVAAGKAIKGTAKAALEDLSMAGTGQGGSKVAQTIMSPGTSFATEPAAGRTARSMLDEIDPAVRKLLEEPKAQARFQGPELPKRTLTTPSKDRPFVSPLDKFFEKGDKPVTVEQLTNQLAKSSRDYEMSRVTQLLEGKSPTDKVRPSDLLKQLEETSPSRFRVEIKEPDPKQMQRFNPNQENPFPSKPLGTVNLLEDITPQEKLATTYMRNISDKEGSYRNIYVPENEANKAMQELEVFFASPMAAKVGGPGLAQKFKADAPKIKSLSNKVDGIYHEMHALDSPLSNAGRFGFDFFGEQRKLIDEAHQKDPQLIKVELMERLKKLETLVTPPLIDKFENAALLGLDKKYGTKMFAHKQALGEDWSKLETREKTKVVESMLGDVIGGDYTKAQVELKELRKPYSDIVATVKRNERSYAGQHTNITSGPEGFSDTFNKPISFSRFQDVTLPTKENVMVIPELQSDRFDDLIKTGPKSATQSKDVNELAQVNKELKSVTDKLYEATDDAARNQLDLQRTKINQRINILQNRILSNEYNTPEFIPGVERMPQVVQQIMVKNAVYAGVQRGKNGVLFPGSDSKQAQLYEKLPNNIRSVLKDLGPGFEMRKVPLEHENGTTIERYGIFWKDDAAKRISTEGIRFKKGGMVDKNDADNQKYI